MKIILLHIPKHITIPTCTYFQTYSIKATRQVFYLWFKDYRLHMLRIFSLTVCRSSLHYRYCSFPGRRKLEKKREVDNTFKVYRQTKISIVEMADTPLITKIVIYLGNLFVRYIIIESKIRQSEISIIEITNALLIIETIISRKFTYLIYYRGNKNYVKYLLTFYKSKL